jgi:ATP-binding cassette subfamily B protein
MIGPELRRASTWVAPYWRRLALVGGLTLAGTLVSLALPYLSKRLVDDALLAGDAGALATIVVLFLLISVVSFGLNVAGGLRYTRVSAEILFAMRLELYRHLQRLSPRFYARTPLGQIVSRINTDVGEVQRMAAETLLAGMGGAVALIGTTAMLAWLDRRLFFISLAMGPPAVWALVRYRRRLEGAVAESRERSAEIGSFLIETLQAIRLVATGNAAEREAARFRLRNDAYVEAVMRMRRLTYLAGGLPGLLLTVGTAAVFLDGGTRVIGGGLTLGTFVAFVAYQMRLLAPVQSLMGIYAGLASARVSLRRLLELLETPADVIEAARPGRLPTCRGEVRFDRVGFTFDRGGPVLDDVSVTVRPGERIAIMGPSGSGKSTIGDLLVRLLDPASGRILLDGHDLRTLALRDVRRHVARVEQEPPILNATIAENIRYIRPDAGDALVAGAARAAALDDLLASLPQALETPVGERGRALSMGERQRIAIARALLADPAVLVLDEATASLDQAAESRVLQGYEAAMRGRTTILITHRRDLAAAADRVLVIEGGRLRDDGPPDLVLPRQPGTFASPLVGAEDAPGS